MANTDSENLPPDDDLWTGNPVIDETNFAALYQRYWRQIHDYCRRRTRNREDAEDICQETFVHAWRSWSSYTRKPGASFLFWLFRIANNLCIDEIRRQNRQPVIQIEPELLERLMPLQPSPDLEASAREQAIAMVMDQLLPSLQEVVQLRYFAKLPNNEVAARLGIKKQAATNRWKRARNALRTLLPYWSFEENDNE